MFGEQLRRRQPGALRHGVITPGYTSWRLFGDVTNVGIMAIGVVICYMTLADTRYLLHQY